MSSASSLPSSRKVGMILGENGLRYSLKILPLSSVKFVRAVFPDENELRDKFDDPSLRFDVWETSENDFVAEEGDLTKLNSLSAGDGGGSWKKGKRARLVRMCCKIAFKLREPTYDM